MIYIDKNSEIIVLPKLVSGEAKELIVEHQISHNRIIIELGEDNTPELNIYTFNIQLGEEWVDGQYDYSLIGELNGCLGQGILQFGDYTQEKKEYQYNNQTIVYNG